MMRLLLEFARNDEGATAIEYSLIAAMLVTALLASWPSFYNGFMTTWVKAGETIQSAIK